MAKIGPLDHLGAAVISEPTVKSFCGITLDHENNSLNSFPLKNELDIEAKLFTFSCHTVNPSMYRGTRPWSKLDGPSLVSLVNALLQGP